ncbi:hypothetical protein [Geothrix limicola]|uniref:hypothetical protein n=1 Tax=Geothrix limicola TaxID=2927978 RepID=UPI00255692B6|nr:hypothetical protein [Geothrix limicola]
MKRVIFTAACSTVLLFAQQTPLSLKASIPAGQGRMASGTSSESSLAGLPQVWIQQAYAGAGWVSGTAYAKGTGPWTYLWSTGDTTQTILVPGKFNGGNTVYTVTVTDSNGVTGTASFVPNW